MSATPTRAAVIGLGPHGRRVVGCLLELPGVELVAVADGRPDALAWPDLPRGAARHATAAALFAAGGIDLVCVVTNGPSHASLALDAMRAGARYVMVEKPFACSLAECDQVIAEAQRRGVRLTVDQSTRHAALYRYLRDQVKSGRWGEPRAMWIQRPNIGLGCNGIHSIDVARFVTGRDVTRVTGWLDEARRKNPRGEEFVDPGGLVVLELGPGVRAVVTQIEDGAGPASLELDCTGARVFVDERAGSIDVVEKDLSTPPGPGRPAVFRKGEVPASAQVYPDMMPLVRGVLQELLADGPMECDPVAGRAAVEILVAAHLSHRRGNVPVALPLTSDEDKAVWLPIT